MPTSGAHAFKVHCKFPLPTLAAAAAAAAVGRPNRSLPASPQRWVFKDYSNRHSDLCRAENWYPSRRQLALKTGFHAGAGSGFRQKQSLKTHLRGRVVVGVGGRGVAEGAEERRGAKEPPAAPLMGKDVLQKIVNVPNGHACLVGEMTRRFVLFIYFSH